MPRDGHGYEGAVRRFGLSGGQPGLSRADFLTKGSAFAGFLALGGGLAACGGDEEAEEGATAAGEAPAEGTISWLSWPGHNDPSFIRPFTDETGIQVRGKEYSGGDNMLALATTSPSGTYDVVQADAEYIVQLKEAGLLEPLNLDEFPAVNDFFEEFRPGAELVPGLVLDGDVYGLIQRFGFLGLAFNSERIPEADAQSFEILFDPRLKDRVFRTPDPLEEACVKLQRLRVVAVQPVRCGKKIADPDPGIGFPVNYIGFAEQIDRQVVPSPRNQHIPPPQLHAGQTSRISDGRGELFRF
jgi:hypothetical protein